MAASSSNSSYCLRYSGRGYIIPRYACFLTYPNADVPVCSSYLYLFNDQHLLLQREIATRCMNRRVQVPSHYDGILQLYLVYTSTSNLLFSKEYFLSLRTQALLARLWGYTTDNLWSYVWNPRQYIFRFGTESRSFVSIAGLFKRAGLLFRPDTHDFPSIDLEPYGMPKLETLITYHFLVAIAISLICRTLSVEFRKVDENAWRERLQKFPFSIKDLTVALWSKWRECWSACWPPRRRWYSGSPFRGAGWHPRRPREPIALSQKLRPSELSQLLMAVFFG